MLNNPLQRLLLVSEPGHSGVFLNVRELVNFLHRHHPEITVDLAYSTRRTWAQTQALADEIRAHGGEAVDLGVNNAPEIRDLPALSHLLGLVKRRAPQVVHAHSSKAGGLCRLLSILPGFPPVLYTPHAYLGMAGRGGAREKFYNLLEAILGRWGRTHNVSADERRFALNTLRVSPRKLVLINNGIPTRRFVPADAAQKAAARDRLGIPREGKLLVTSGRESLQKNYGPLYAAVDRFMSMATIPVLFAHAGQGAIKYREAMEPVNRSRCFAFEYLADVRELLWAADGFVLTSFYEGLSVSMLEALSCGIPLLLTNAPGLAGMRAYGLPIEWMPNPNGCANFEAEVLKSLVAWSEQPTGIRMDQHALAESTFNTTTQHGKLIRLYRRMANEA